MESRPTDRSAARDEDRAARWRAGRARNHAPVPGLPRSPASSRFRNCPIFAKYGRHRETASTEVQTSDPISRGLEGVAGELSEQPLVVGVEVVTPVGDLSATRVASVTDHRLMPKIGTVGDLGDERAVGVESGELE